VKPRTILTIVLNVLLWFSKQTEIGNNTSFFKLLKRVIFSTSISKYIISRKVVKHTNVQYNILKSFVLSLNKFHPTIDRLLFFMHDFPRYNSHCIKINIFTLDLTCKKADTLCNFYYLAKIITFPDFLSDSSH
jgi:hypothetical protein